MSNKNKKEQKKIWNCRAGINGWHEVGCPHLEKNKESNNLLEVRLQEETDRLNHAFNKCLENATKISNCNQPITITCDDTVFIKPTIPQSDWEEDLAIIHRNYESTVSLIYQLLIEEYRKGYNACLRDYKIPNKYGEKSL